MKNTDPELLLPDDQPGPVEMSLIPQRGELIAFKPFLEILAENEANALTMEITADMPPEQRAALAEEARRLRLDCFRKARCSADDAKDELKKDILRIGNAIDEANRDIRDRCKKAESHLQAIEDFEENERQRQEDETRKRRAEEIRPYLTGPLAVDLGKIDEAQYQQQLTDARELHEMRAERERKAKEEQEARERAAEEERQRVAAEKEAERQRIAAENERLRAEAEKREKEAKKERDRIAAERAKERAEAEKREKAIREQARIEREAAENTARIEREKQAAAAKAERDRLAAEKAEADRKVREMEATEKARKAAEDKERKAKETADRKAAAAPDAQKVRAYGIAIPTPPVLQNKHAAVAMLSARESFMDALDAIHRKLKGGEI